MEARVSDDGLPQPDAGTGAETDSATKPLSASSSVETSRARRGRWFRACGLIALLSIVVGLGLKAWSHPQFGGWSLGLHELGELWAQAPGRTIGELAIRVTSQFGALAALLAILGLTITAQHESPGHPTRMLLAIPAAFLVWLGIVAMQGSASAPSLFAGAIATLVWLTVGAVACMRRSHHRRLGWLLAFAAIGAIANFVASRFPTSHDASAWTRVLSIVGLGAQTQAIALAGHWWATTHRPGLRAAVLAALATLGALGTALLVNVASSEGDGGGWALRVLRDSAESTPDVMLKPWAALLSFWGVLLAAAVLLARPGRLAIPATGVALIVMAQAQLGRPICLLYLALGSIALGLDAVGVTRQGVRQPDAGA